MEVVFVIGKKRNILKGAFVTWTTSDTKRNPELKYVSNHIFHVFPGTRSSVEPVDQFCSSCKSGQTNVVYIVCIVY